MNERLYDLLPVIHRLRDHEQGEPLRALLAIIAEQVTVVEEDIAQLYDNWFIETCQPWVVPYIADLLGYQNAVADTPATATDSRREARNAVLLPRRDVANLIRSRRRKGTLALLEQLAYDGAGWPARAVEFRTLLAQTQSLNHPQPQRGQTADLRNPAALDQIDSAFDSFAHTVDVRDHGWFNLANVGVFVWRIKPYSVTHAPANNLEAAGAHCFTFSILGNDAPLYTNPQAESDPTTIADELNLPTPIRRHAFAAQRERYYGAGKSLMIWTSHQKENKVVQSPVDVSRIVVADLTDWQYRPATNHVAIDPVLGRMVFGPSRELQGVWVSYYYGFSADIGGGEYQRALVSPADVTSFIMEDILDPAALVAALRDSTAPIMAYLRSHFSSATQERLQAYNAGEAVDETLLQAIVGELNTRLADEHLDTPERFSGITLRPDITQLRDQEPRDWQHLNRWLIEAALRGLIAPHFEQYTVCTPYGVGDQHITIKDGIKHSITDALNQWRRDRPRHAIIEIADNSEYTEPLVIELQHGQQLQIRAAVGARPVIRLLDQRTNRPDSLSVTGTSGGCLLLDGLLIRGRAVHISGTLDAVHIRHCTLVPGWELEHDCRPRRPEKPSIEIHESNLQLRIDSSIIGTIHVYHNEVTSDPISIEINDTIVDATGSEREALGAPGYPLAHATLAIARSTVFGQIQTHAIMLAEDTILTGTVHVARRQIGCMRFCYVPPASRTPRRYNCQPDLVVQALHEQLTRQEINVADLPLLEGSERLRVQPQFNSTRYGMPSYAQLAPTCAREISAGASDEAEMGAFHDLYQPQRAALLASRLAEYTPADATARVIYAS